MCAVATCNRGPGLIRYHACGRTATNAWTRRCRIAGRIRSRRRASGLTGSNHRRHHSRRGEALSVLWKLDRKTGKYLGHNETMPQNIWDGFDPQTGEPHYRKDIPEQQVGQWIDASLEPATIEYIRK